MLVKHIKQKELCYAEKSPTDDMDKTFTNVGLTAPTPIMNAFL